MGTNFSSVFILNLFKSSKTHKCLNVLKFRPTNNSTLKAHTNVLGFMCLHGVKMLAHVH